MTDEELWQLCIEEEERKMIIEEDRKEKMLKSCKNDDEFWSYFNEGLI